MTLAVKIQVLSFKNELKGFRKLAAGKKGDPLGLHFIFHFFKKISLQTYLETVSLENVNQFIEIC